jgi:hypothetical protein
MLLNLLFIFEREGQQANANELRVTSHYGWRSRGRRSSPIRFQDNKNSAYRPFTLEAKVQGWRSPRCLHGNIFSSRRWSLERKLGLDRNGKTQTMVERLSILFLKNNHKLTRCWPLTWRGCFVQGNKVGCSFFLWTLGLDFGGFTLCNAEGSNS